MPTPLYEKLTDLEVGHGCSKCRGYGIIDAGKIELCPDCGSHEIDEIDSGGEFYCYACRGYKGHREKSVEDMNCPDCEGTGKGEDTFIC